jgi:hypothetical protein
MNTALTQDDILNAIRNAALALGRAPSRSEFEAASGITEYQVLRFFPSWREAVRAAGLTPNTTNCPLAPEVLLEDWGELVRRLRRIPTRESYRQEGTFSPSGIEKKLGPWSNIPAKFREFADGKTEWADVVALLPAAIPFATNSEWQRQDVRIQVGQSVSTPVHRHARLSGRPTYGNPIDFRGLRHEPVNEDGVIFLFGMVARELGYLVEAVQAGYPDCEAKRQIDAGKWQRVRIEFEFESRNFRDHGHPPDGCDLIVCWRHNWAECPANLEVVELRSVLGMLSSADD